MCEWKCFDAAVILAAASSLAQVQTNRNNLVFVITADRIRQAVAGRHLNVATRQASQPYTFV
jgi:hypothetical protein